MYSPKSTVKLNKTVLIPAYQHILYTCKMDSGTHSTGLLLTYEYIVL